MRAQLAAIALEYRDFGNAAQQDRPSVAHVPQRVHAATALAEKIAGSNEAFAERMNRRAQELGLEGSTFYDPHGLPSPGNENVMTARDLAVLGNELMRYSLMREYAATPTLPFENATFTSGLTNPNFLLRQYDGAYGIKTGYTASAGFSVTAAARRGDTDVIAVLTGARSSRGPQSSFALVGRLIDEVFDSWSTVVPVREGDSAGEVPVQRGTAPRVEAVVARNVTATIASDDSSMGDGIDGLLCRADRARKRNGTRGQTAEVPLRARAGAEHPRPQLDHVQVELENPVLRQP